MSVEVRPTDKAAKARIAVLGASGYTGAEVVRLCALHPHMNIVSLTGERQAGKVQITLVHIEYFFWSTFDPRRHWAFVPRDSALLT